MIDGCEPFIRGQWILRFVNLKRRRADGSLYPGRIGWKRIAKEWNKLNAPYTIKPDEMMFSYYCAIEDRRKMLDFLQE